VALLSDAGHNLGDVAGLALSLFAFKLAKLKPTHQYTYGYKKTTILAALINSVVLLIAIGIIGYESVTRLSKPEAVQGNVMAWTAGIGIIINTISAFLFFRNKEHDLNTKGAFLHLATDASVSAVVVISGIIIRYTGYYMLDAVVSLVILAVILVSTWSLLRSSLRLSLDAVPNDIDMDATIQVMRKVNGVNDVHHVHIWAMSTTENALTAHVVLDNSLDFDKKMQVVHEVKHELYHHKIQHATIEIESGNAACEDETC
jgi:cobalt-zinc-cadmium efflux system protein